MTTCVICAGSTVTGGYGRKMVGGRRYYAHRLAWEQAHGPIPEGLDVLHKCDNRACVNVDHLFLGTQADNVADMWAKGRGAGGDRNGSRLHPERLARGDRHSRGNARLTEITARVAMKRLLAGETQKSVGYAFGVGQGAIHKLWSGKSWAHLFGSTPHAMEARRCSEK